MTEVSFFDAITKAATDACLPSKFGDVWVEVKRLCEMAKRDVNGRIQSSPLLFKIINLLTQLPCEEMVQMLAPFFSCGVDVNALDDNKRNILHIICFNWSGLTDEKLSKLVTIFVNKNVHTDHVDYEGNTPFSMAIIRGVKNLNIISKLLSPSPSILDRKNIHGQSPLSLAFTFSDEKVVSFLLSQNPIVENLDPEDNTVLHKLLVSYVNLIKRANAPDIDWDALWTKFSYLKNRRNSKSSFPIEAILQEKTIMLPYSQFVQLLPDSEFINCANSDEETLLSLTVKAVREAEFSFIHAVLQRGANINTENLIKAAISSKTDVPAKVQTLVRLGANMDISDVKFVLRQREADLTNRERILIIEPFIYDSNEASKLAQEIPDIAVAMCMFYLSEKELLPLELLVKLITELQIKFSATSKDGWALMDLLAIYSPDEGQVISLLTSLLKKCPDLEVDENQASIAVQFAIWEGKFKLAGVLLKYFASVDAFKAQGVTVNYFRTRGGGNYLNLVKLMVASGVPYKSTLVHLTTAERKELVHWMNNRPLLELAITQLLRMLATRRKIAQFLNELEDLPHLKKFLYLDHLEL